MSNKCGLKFLSSQKINRNRPLFVYLPGMDGTGELLKAQDDKLALHFDLRCLSIPSHCFGNWEDLVEDTIDLIKSELTLSHDRTLYLCGESFGGCLALKIALAIPSLIHRLILVNPASSFNQRPILGLGVNITGLLPTWLHRYSAVGLLPFLAQLNRITDSNCDSLIRAMKSLPPQIVSWRLSLLRDFGVSRSDLLALTMSCLILAGGEDRLLPSVEEAERLVKILPNAKTVVLPQSGHACLLEAEISLHDILTEQGFMKAPTELVTN